MRRFVSFNKFYTFRGYNCMNIYILYTSKFKYSNLKLFCNEVDIDPGMVFIDKRLGVSTCSKHELISATWMVIKIWCYIINFALINRPTVILFIMSHDLLRGVEDVIWIFNLFVLLCDIEELLRKKLLL